MQHAIDPPRVAQACYQHVIRNKKTAQQYRGALWRVAGAEQLHHKPQPPGACTGTLADSHGGGSPVMEAVRCPSTLSVIDRVMTRCNE